MSKGASFRTARIGRAEIELGWLEEGRGPLVLLLHGFPDTPRTWRFQWDALVGAGYRVVAPWLRGYGPSAKPRGVGAYRVDALVEDAVGLIDVLGDGRAALLGGHDWGGIVAWTVAARFPALVDRLLIVNAPHPAAFARELMRPAQMLRSSYVGFFQLPWLPERLLARKDFLVVRRLYRKSLHHHRLMTNDDWRDVRAALAAPGALTAAVNYYRAAGRDFLLRRAPAAGPLPPVAAPTLLLWGLLDGALSPRLADGNERWAPALTVRRFRKAGHWSHWDEWSAATSLVLEHLAAGRRDARAG